MKGLSLSNLKKTIQFGFLLTLFSCAGGSYLANGEGDFLDQQEDQEHLRVQEDFVSFKSGVFKSVRVDIVISSESRKLIKEAQLLVVDIKKKTTRGFINVASKTFFDPELPTTVDIYLNKKALKEKQGKNRLGLNFDLKVEAFLMAKELKSEGLDILQSSSIKISRSEKLKTKYRLEIPGNE